MYMDRVTVEERPGGTLPARLKVMHSQEADSGHYGPGHTLYFVNDIQTRTGKGHLRGVFQRRHTRRSFQIKGRRIPVPQTSAYFYLTDLTAVDRDGTVGANLTGNAIAIVSDRLLESTTADFPVNVIRAQISRRLIPQARPSVLIRHRQPAIPEELLHLLRIGTTG